MYISRLRLLNFRIYREAAVELPAGVTLVLGQNGQGKTSLLESMATLALTRSPRAASLGECATWGESRLGVAAQLEDRRGEAELELLGQRDAGSGRWARRLRQNHSPTSARELLGRLRVVVFWPDDLQLVKGGPEPRRRLLDVVLSQLSPGYAEQLLRYRRAVEHRTALLRRLGEGGAAAEELGAWSDALVEHGAAVIAQRSWYLAAAAPMAAAALAGVGEEMELALRYRPALGSGSRDWTGADAAGLLRRALAEQASEERVRGQCLCGPHRDDFEILLTGRSARQFASQGQQRSIALALKVAEVRQHLLIAGETPLLLLDDVLSELDRGRRQGLLSLLGQELAVEQTVITATEDPGLGAEVPTALVLQAEAGLLSPQPGATISN